MTAGTGVAITSFGSSELIAAAVGAIAAFAFQAFLSWRERCRREQDLANSALLTLAQMYNHLKPIYEQTYVEQAATLRKELRREPFNIEFRSPVVVAEFIVRIDLGSLAFLLRSHDPDVANRLAQADRCYVGDVMTEKRRAELHREAQQRLDAKDVDGAAPTTLGVIKGVVGHGLYAQVDQLTTAQREGLPQTLQLLVNVGNSLREVVGLQYPTRRFVSFRPQPTPDDHEPRLASRWRVLLRRVVDGYRRRDSKAPLKLNR